MTDETLDPRFGRDLRAVLGETAPPDAPATLYASVAGVARRAPARQGWSSRRMAFARLAMAAVVVIAVAAIAVALRPFGDLPVIGGPVSPAPTPARSLHLKYELLPRDGTQPGPKDIEAVVTVLQARLDATGVAESLITTATGEPISLDINVDPSDEATVQQLRQLLGTTGRLDVVPLGNEPASSGQTLDLVAHPPLFSGDQVVSAKLGSDQTGARTVDFSLRPEGARLFADYTQASIGTFFAIVLDGTVISAPVINSAIPDGEVQITQGGIGGYPLDEAQSLIAILGSGALPFPIREVSNDAGPMPSDLLTSAPPAPTTPAPSGPPPSTVADSALVSAARAYADAAGIAIATGGTPLVGEAVPDFDTVALRQVTLPGADAGDGPLQVFFDDAGRIGVVGIAAPDARPTGADVASDGALAAAAHQFGLVGIDPSQATLRVAGGSHGADWYVSLDRAIDGHPVANMPMLWRIAGDWAYVMLRRDGALRELYAIRPASEPAPQILETGVLDAALGTIAGLTADELAVLDPALAWVRAVAPITGETAPTLTQGYCATRVQPSGWDGWCVDAGTGREGLVAGGMD